MHSKLTQSSYKKQVIPYNPFQFPDRKTTCFLFILIYYSCSTEETCLPGKVVLNYFQCTFFWDTAAEQSERGHCVQGSPPFGKSSMIFQLIHGLIWENYINQHHCRILLSLIAANIFALKNSSLFHKCLFFAMKPALLGEPSTTFTPSDNFLGFYFSTFQVQIVFDLKRASIVSQKEKACRSIVFMRYYFYKTHYKFEIYCQGWDKQKMSTICSCPGWACCNTRQF